MVAVHVGEQGIALRAAQHILDFARQLNSGIERPLRQ
jgi:hypothetical protein